MFCRLLKLMFIFFFPSLVLETLEIASVNLPIPVQTQNYYKNISDNKEIVKLVSVLSTVISSTKKVGAIHGAVAGPGLPSVCLHELHRKFTVQAAQLLP